MENLDVKIYRSLAKAHAILTETENFVNPNKESEETMSSDEYNSSDSQESTKNFYPMKVRLEKKEKLTFYFESQIERQEMMQKVLAE